MWGASPPLQELQQKKQNRLHTLIWPTPKCKCVDASPPHSHERSARRGGVSLPGAVESAVADSVVAESRRHMFEGAQRPSLCRRRHSAVCYGEPKAANVCPRKRQPAAPGQGPPTTTD